jgi:predicted nucleic acid-binding protein
MTSLFRRFRPVEQAVAEGRRLVTDAEVLQEILHRYAAIGRKDAIHLAVMQRHGVRTVMSFDAGYDGFPGIRRLPTPG